MRKISLFFVILSMLCIIGCELTKKDKNTSIDNIKINQKIVLIYRYLNYSDTVKDWGFYVNGNGDKIFYDFSEIPRKNLEGIEDGLPIIYELLKGENEVNQEGYLNAKDVSQCYKLLSQISEDYEFKEKSAGSADCGTYTWYGVLDDGVNAPQFILLSKEGDWKGNNTDENAKQIIKILKKME